MFASSIMMDAAPKHLPTSICFFLFIIFRTPFFFTFFLKMHRAFTNKYYKLKEDGMYCCVVCGEDLFRSSTKYDSGSGWPAFYDVMDTRRVKLTKDASHGKSLSAHRAA